MLSYEFIQFLNEKAIEYFPVDKVKIGDKYKMRCPICGDSHKNAFKKRGFWYCKTASYYCFNCGVSLPGIKFIEAMAGTAYEDIKREYIRLFAKSGFDNSLSARFETPKEESIFDFKPMIRPEWKKPLTDAARKYLESRKIFDAPFLRDELFSCYGKNNAEYILIPWTVNGVDAYYQLNDYLKHGQLKYIFPKNSRKLVFGLDNIDVTWPYIICFEGVYDSLFVKNAIATGTKSISDYQLDLIRKRYPKHQLCVSFDNDTPGMTSMMKFVENMPYAKFFRWFDNSTTQKDINEYVMAKNDVNAFSDAKKLEHMMFSPLQMKMWLAENGISAPDKMRKYNKCKRERIDTLAGAKTILQQ